jgi:hypothetical protein
MVLPVTDDPQGMGRPFNGVMATNSNEIAELSEQVTGRLHERFPRIPINTVQEIVEEIYDGCRIRAFIPLLVERRAVTVCACCRCGS